APDDGTVVFDEEAHRHDFHTETFDRLDLVAFLIRPFFDTHHIRHAKAINIAVDETNAFAGPCECDCEVHRNGGLAYAAFTAGNRDELHAALRMQNRMLVQPCSMPFNRLSSFLRTCLSLRLRLCL